jgi:hypothetical protein
VTAPTWRGAQAEIVKTRIRRALLDRLETLIELLFGAPTRRTKRSWRFAGAIEVDVAGRKRGAWRQWSGTAKGDPLAAIRFYLGDATPWPEVWTWAARFVGIAPPGAHPETPAERRERERRQREWIAAERKRRAAEVEIEEAAQIAGARARWEAGSATIDAIGERHLVEVRGTPRPPGGWPACIRWDGAKCALIFGATNAAGEIERVQEIHLKPDGTNKRRLDGSKIKLTYGPVTGGAAVRFPALGDRGLDAPLLHFEGPENALTAWRATGRASHAWLGLGVLIGAPLAPGRSHIIGRDDDEPGKIADRQLETALDRWRLARIRVAGATPWPERRGDKSDFNDVLRAAIGPGAAIEPGEPGPAPVASIPGADQLSPRQLAGLAAVAARIRAAELELHGLASAPAPFPLPSADRAAVWRHVAETVARFGLHRLDDDPPKMLMTDPTGAGKTEEIIAALINWAAVCRAARRPHRVFYLVPEHRLGREIEARIAKPAAEAGLTVAIYRGRQPPADEIAAAEAPLCDNLPAVELAEAALFDVEKTVCGPERGEHQCEFRQSCRWFAQLARAASADIVIAAHNFVFRALPKPLTKNIGTVIIDEDPKDHGYSITELETSLHSDQALREHPPLTDEGEPDPDAFAELQRGFVALQSVDYQIEQGRTSAEATAAEGLTKRRLGRLRVLNWTRKIDPEMWPGMPIEQRRAAAKRAAGINPALPKMAALFHALADAAPDRIGDAEGLAALDARTGSLEEAGIDPGSDSGIPDDVDPSDGDDLNAGRADRASERVKVEAGVITVHGLKPVAAWLANRPVLIASATADPELIRQWFPTLQHSTPPAPAMPFVTIRQYHGGFGKRAMARRRPALIERARYEMADLGADGLTITYKQHAPAFREALDGASVAHHGGLIGADRFRHVKKELVFGAPFPTDRQIARLASCEAGRIVPVEAPVATPCRALLATGEGVEFNRMAYRDPAAQAVLQRVYDAAAIQAIGRARPLLRTAADPVEIIYCGNVPLPFPVASIGRLHPVTKLEKVIATGIVSPSGAYLHRLHPDVFPSEEAGRAAIWRAGGRAEVWAATRQAAGRRDGPSVRVILQPAGQGHGLQDLVAPLDQLAVVEAILRRQFPAGLARWEVRPFSEGRSPIAAGEDHYARLQNTKTGDRNALRDPIPAHPVQSPPVAASAEARAPPD